MWFDLGTAIDSNAIIKFLVSMSLILSVVRKILVGLKYQKVFCSQYDTSELG